MLHRVANLVQESLELEPTCYAVLTGVTAGLGLGFNRAMLFLVDDSRRGILRGVSAVGPADADEADRVWRSIESEEPDLHTLYASGLDQAREPSALDLRVRATAVDVTGDSPPALALRRSALVRGEGGDDLGGLLHLPTAVAAPMRGRDSVRGVLYADDCFTGRQLDPVGELVFAMIADHAGHAIESAHRYEEVARMAQTDALTGLGHHGALMQALAEAVHEARTQALELGLAMIDLDDFKRVNDTLGHLAGDALLAGVATRLRHEVRAGETPFRYGGEEFAVLLPAAPAPILARVGERLRTAVGARPFSVSGGRSVWITCSVGLASLSERASTVEALVEAADQALLRAKRAGKNRIELAP